MPQINNSDIPVNPSGFGRRNGEAAREEVLFLQDDYNLISLNDIVPLHKWGSKLNEFISTLRETVHVNRIRVALNNLTEDLSRPINELKEPINLSMIKKLFNKY
jgi:hypothetical protein